jgi:1-acyl-sn-glycerol-3-phosphate acyltransferase
LAHIAALLGRGNWRIRRQFGQMSPAQRAQAVEQWSRDMLKALGVALHSQGDVPTHGPVLMVCNHVTWLDILVLHACSHARFVAKSEVHHWPLIGPMAAAAGTLFIERASRRDAMRVVHQMVAALQAGDVLAVFPEGTTSDGLQLLPFHANLIQAAISANAPVLPAETAACAIPSRTCSMATRIDESFFLRKATSKASSISTTSLANTLVTRGWEKSAKACGKPTNTKWASACEARNLRQAGRVTGGPKSPPIQSTAMVIMQPTGEKEVSRDSSAWT